MPRKPRVPRTKRNQETEIPADLMAWLRGVHYDRPEGEQPSDLFGNVCYFWSAEKSLTWLEDTWKKHEKLIRSGLDEGEEPYVLEKIHCFRLFVNSGREWGAKNK